MPNRIIRSLAVIALLLIAMAGCGRKEEQVASGQLEKIECRATAWPASAPFYIALEKGYFKDEGLDATIRSVMSGHIGLEAVLSGEADITVSGESPIARAIIEGRPVAVIANVCNIEEAILIIARRDKGISEAKDLRGKRIGVVATTTAHFFLDTFLAVSHVDSKDVQIVGVEADQLVDALLKGEVDAVSTWAPHTFALREKLGDEAVVFDDSDIYTMTWVITTTQDFSNKHPERVKKFLRAVARANKFISERPSEAQAVTSTHIGVNSPFLGREWREYSFMLALDQSLVLNLEDQARWMIEDDSNDARKIPNMLDFIYVDALRAVMPEAVRIVGK